MKYYIIQTEAKKFYLETPSGVAYLMGHPTHGENLEGRQLMNCETGQYGPVMQAYVQACKHFRLPVRYAWTGIANELGDHSEVTPPTKGRTISELGAVERLHTIEV